MQTDWRTIAQQIPEAVLIDLAEYAPELDAIEEATRRTLEAYGQPQMISPFGWGDPVVEDSIVVRTKRRAIAPVKSSDPARVAVALLQRLFLAGKWSFADTKPVNDFGGYYVLLAMADQLLARRLHLNVETARDLIALVNAPALTSSHRQAYEYL